MNELVLKEMNAEHVICLYRPNGEGEPGEIEYSFKDNKAVIKAKSPGDDTGYFGRKAYSKVEEYVDKKSLPLRSIQAWY